MDIKDFRSCYITYKEGIFHAYSFDYDKRYYTPRESDPKLEELLVKCRKAGFNHLDGLRPEAIHAAGGIDDSEGDSVELSKKERAVLEYVEDLWQGGDYAVRYLGHRQEGPEEKDAKATKVNLERYGIKPAPPRGGVVTPELVNKLKDELGL